LDEQAARALQHQLNAPAVGAAAGGGFYSGFVPPNTRGRLSITVAQARLSKNYGLMKMDPYCRVRVGNTVFETPTDPAGGKNPHWNRTEHSNMPNGIDAIYLEIYDERAFTTDERVAYGHITIPESVFNGDTIDDWYCLSGQQGEAKEGMINLVMTLHSITAAPVTYIPMTQPRQQPGGVVVVPSGAGVGVPIQVPGGAPISYANPQLQQQAQQPQQPMFTEEDVKELTEMFPSIDAEVVKSVLEEKRGNKDAAANALMSMMGD
jgi:toll-interacting protein